MELVQPVGGAYHSPLMEPARVELVAIIKKAEFRTPHCSIYQNVDALSHTDPKKGKVNVLTLLISVVRWTDSVKHMIDDGAKEFVECGSEQVLTGFACKNNEDLDK